MIHKLDSFFFKPIPITGIVRMRILIGLILIIQALALLPGLDHFFGPDAFVSTLSLYAPGAPHLRLIDWLGGSGTAVRTVLGIHLVAALGFTIGFFTRTSGVIAYLTLISIHHQNLTILNSGDTALRFALFFLIWCPSGGAWSVDSRFKTTIPEHSPWALRMIQLQTATIYLFTAISKLNGHSWRDGTAAYYASRLWDFERFGFDPVFNSLTAMKILTWASVGLELALGTLIWIPFLRIPLILIGITFHLCIEYSMNIPWFEWIMIILLVGMWPDHRTFFPCMSRRMKSLKS
jgi:uncharacterized membrane protein YphA (DoxX/SURF4 family)